MRPTLMRSYDFVTEHMKLISLYSPSSIFALLELDSTLRYVEFVSEKTIIDDEEYLILELDGTDELLELQVQMKKHSLSLGNTYIRYFYGGNQASLFDIGKDQREDFFQDVQNTLTDHRLDAYR